MSTTTSTEAKTRLAPGRKREVDSALSKSRRIYAEKNGTLERREIVNLIAALSATGKSEPIGKAVANTYYHLIHREATGTVTSRKPRASTDTQA